RHKRRRCCASPSFWSSARAAHHGYPAILIEDDQATSPKRGAVVPPPALLSLAGCGERLFTPCCPLGNLPLRERAEGRQPVFTQGVEDQDSIEFHNLPFSTPC